jgi:hypothetical protein
VHVPKVKIARVDRDGTGKDHDHDPYRPEEENLKLLGGGIEVQSPVIGNALGSWGPVAPQRPVRVLNAWVPLDTRCACRAAAGASPVGMPAEPG